MSAGVSDQRMKGQSNQVISSSSKNVESEERTSIPWSQQVDEAYETTLASPTEGNSGCCETSSGGTQFQYPPFNVKESGWSGKSSRRTSSNNYINDGIYGQSYGQQQNQQAYNYFTKNNGDYNSWNSNQVNSQHSRRTHYDDCRSDGGSHQNDSIKSVQRGMQNMGLEGNTSRSMGDTNSSGMSNAKKDTQVASVPKKMTWASIASQPAKPTLRTSSSSSTLKKKGPGMPPPPMVPGKHNMDIGTWDSPKNGPVLVPPPPPPVIPVPIMEPFNLGQTKSNSGSTNIGQSSSKEEHNLSTAPQQHHHPQQQQQHHQKSLGPNNNQSQNINQSSASSMNSNQHVRPPWISQNNPSASNTKNIHQQSQHSRSNSNQGHSSAGPGNQSNTGYHHGQSMISHQHQQSQQNHPQHQQQHQPPVPVQLPHSRPLPATSPTLSNSSSNYPVLDELRDKNNYNPPEIDMEKAAVARFFIIKSYSEDDIHRSIKYEIWCSTEHGNKRLDEAFRERQSEGGVVYLFFSVNGSRHFCGMAQMMTPVDYNSVASVWSQDKWKGKFKVKWVYVKDVPNLELRHIRLENNDNKSVTNSRDTQEVPNVRGQEVLMIIHAFKHETSIFDDFYHYEKRQEEEVSKKYEPPHLRQQNSIEGNPNAPAPLKPLRGEAGGGGGGGSVGSAGSGGRGGGGGTGPTGGIGSADFDRNYDNRYHDRGNGGGAGSAPGSGGYRNFNRGGGFQNFDNRRNDDHRGFDRMARDKDNQDQPGHFNHNRENNGDFHNNRGFHRGDYNRRDDRVYNNRDRDQYHDGNSGGFMRNDNNRGTGGFRDNFNRERDHFSRGRGRGGGPHRN